jgi:hypothetical protein
MDKNSSPGVTPINSFENDVMGITPIDNSQFNNPEKGLFLFTSIIKMTYNKERHKQLVIHSQELKNQGKNLFLENPEEGYELSKYNVGVEEQVFWTHREDFVLIIKNFLNNNI